MSYYFKSESIDLALGQNLATDNFKDAISNYWFLSEGDDPVWSHYENVSQLDENVISSSQIYKSEDFPKNLSAYLPRRTYIGDLLDSDEIGAPFNHEEIETLADALYSGLVSTTSFIELLKDLSQIIHGKEISYSKIQSDSSDYIGEMGTDGVLETTVQIQLISFTAKSLELRINDCSGFSCESAFELIYFMKSNCPVAMDKDCRIRFLVNESEVFSVCLAEVMPLKTKATLKNSKIEMMISDAVFPYLKEPKGDWIR